MCKSGKIKSNPLNPVSTQMEDLTNHLDLLQVSLLINKQTGGKKKRRDGKMEEQGV